MKVPGALKQHRDATLPHLCAGLPPRALGLARWVGPLRWWPADAHLVVPPPLCPLLQVPLGPWPQKPHLHCGVIADVCDS